MKWIAVLIITTITIFMVACTPKTTEPAKNVTATKVEKPKPKPENLSPCQKWIGEPFEDDALQNHVLYRDQMKVQNYDEAFKLWKEVYKVAPAADGQRDVHYMDGARIYKHFYYKPGTTDAQKTEYRNKIMDLYGQAIECYPDKASSYKSLIAYDYFYTFPGTISDEKIYAMYKEIVDADNLETSVSVLNPFTALIVNLLLEEKIPMPEAQKYAGKIMEIFEHNKKEKSKKEWKKEGWDIVESYAPARLEQLEGVEGFYDCAYFKNKYYGEFEAAPTDCDIIGSTIGRLKWAKCDDADVSLTAVRVARDQQCKVAPPAPGPLRLAGEALENGNYNQAIKYYQEYINSVDDAEKKARYNLRIAKIYYVHLKSFSRARQYAREASSHRPDWGEPYMLIGTLYASSGPLCGPGRGWDSQIVTWPAIDKWKQAKAKDSSVASEANKLINRYEKYMPSIEDIFQRSLKEGSSFSVGCWIQETTTIRAAP